MILPPAKLKYFSILNVSYFKNYLGLLSRINKNMATAKETTDSPSKNPITKLFEDPRSSKFPNSEDILLAKSPIPKNIMPFIIPLPIIDFQFTNIFIKLCKLVFINPLSEKRFFFQCFQIFSASSTTIFSILSDSLKSP